MGEYVGRKMEEYEKKNKTNESLWTSCASSFRRVGLCYHLYALPQDSVSPFVSPLLAFRFSVPAPRVPYV